MPNQRVKSRIAADILRDRGTPKGGLNDAEARSGNPMDDVDRGGWPDIEELETPQAATSGVAKSRNRSNPAKQPGTTGGE
jgi:hypothetical protein